LYVTEEVLYDRVAVSDDDLTKLYEADFTQALSIHRDNLSGDRIVPNNRICAGPGCGVEWACDRQYDLIEGRCAECRIMAEAASNLNVEQLGAVLATTLTRKRRISPAGPGTNPG
jgi:hypothetical protein